MIGPTRPTAKPFTRVKNAGRRFVWSLVAITALWTLADGAPVRAEPVTARLRIAWGSNVQSPQKWIGTISAPEATLSAVAPLGVEADEAAAIRLVDKQIRVEPFVRRMFDGCDVTVTGDEAATVRVQLRNASAAEAKDVELSLGELAKGKEPVRTQLDGMGGYLLVQRAPGDKLRVSISRDHLVFDPDEAIELSVTPDLKADANDAALAIEARLYRVGGSGEPLWQQSLPVETEARSPLALALKAPGAEGAYRLSIAARRPVGFAEKFVPWELSAPVVTRDVEFVVVDPRARLPRLADKWEVVATIDAANPRWWQRVPQWTQLDRLPGLASARPIGSSKPAVGVGEYSAFIELAAPRMGDEPTWHAYPLATPVGSGPYAVEIELPRGATQRLGVSIIEPDAAGRALAFGRDCALYSAGRFAPSDGKSPRTEVQRLTFWPRTNSPLLLLSNQSASHAAHYGKIRLVRRLTAPAPVESAAPADAEKSPPMPPRLVAAYVSVPQLADCLGTAEQLDAPGGLSVDGWGVFLAAASRLAQELNAAGFNAAIVSVSADGGSLAPLEALGASPRFDTGQLSSAAPDPVRKDVLEVLLRVFDREGLAFIPAVELSAPSGPLEALRQQSGARSAGVECLNADGRTWLECYPNANAMGPAYNPLSPEVQAVVRQVLEDLVARYGDHRSLTGVALQLAGTGYGVLPGLDWGVDDSTLSRFAADVQFEVPQQGPMDRATRIAISQSRQWHRWRQQQLTQFYAGLAQRLTASRPDRQLVLCTEKLFRGPAAARRLRRGVSGDASLNDAAAELGVDLGALAELAGVALLRPRLLGPEESLQRRIADLQVNGGAEFDQAVAERPRSGELFYHGAERLRLASFDAKSPFGADKTYLSLSCPQFPQGEASRRPYAEALARRDFTCVVEGAEQLPLALGGEASQLRRLFRDLPVDHTDFRTERHQPVALRIYRSPGVTTLCLINESPWPVTCDLPLEGDATIAWQQLGVADGAAGDGATATTGAWPAGPQTWKVALPPYGVEGRRFESRSLRIGALSAAVDEGPAAVLAQRIAEIEQRMRNLDVERRYNELSNPDFELTGGDGRAVGWQPRMGAGGAVEVDEATACTGQRSLRLQSVDAVGVAAQSHQFSIPVTGQLVVRAQIRVADLAPDAQVYVWVEYEDAGVTRQEYSSLGTAKTLSGDWSTCEFALNNLPINPPGKMRVHFYLTGRGEAWIDNVQLYDLQFPDPQRVALGKMLYAARSALDAGHLVECQRLVEGYWPRYLMEHVPPSMVAIRPEAAPGAGDARAGDAGGSPTLGDRVRKLAPPKIWR